MFLWGGILLSFAVRLYAGWSWQPHLQPDSMSYVEPARHLVAEGTLGDMLTRTPVYPLFLAAIYRLGGGNRAVVLVQHLMGILLILMTMWMAGLVFRKRSVALLAAFILGSGTLLFSYEQIVLSDCLLTFLTLAAIVAFLAFLSGRSEWWLAACGLAIGLGTLCRPILMLFPAIPLAVMLGRKEGLRVFLRRAGVLLLPFLLLVSSWSVRNWVRNDYLGLTPFLGRNIILRAEALIDYDGPDHSTVRKIYGKHYHASWDGHRYAGNVVWPSYHEAREKTGLEEAELDRIFLEMALGGIMRHPLRYLGGTFKEMGRMFLYNYTPLLEVPFTVLGIHSSRVNQPARRLMASGEWGPLAIKVSIVHSNKPFMVFFVVGLVVFAGNWFRESCPDGMLFLLLTIAYFSVLTVAVELGLPRYRLPMEPIVATISAYGLWKTCGRLIRWGKT